MFLGTLSSPFFNHLIGSSSAGFTKLILTGERVEAGIRNGKIQKDASASTVVKKPFTGRKEVSTVYSQRNQGEPSADQQWGPLWFWSLHQTSREIISREITSKGWKGQYGNSPRLTWLQPKFYHISWSWIWPLWKRHQKIPILLLHITIPTPDTRTILKVQGTTPTIVGLWRIKFNIW